MEFGGSGEVYCTVMYWLAPLYELQEARIFVYLQLSKQSKSITDLQLLQRNYLSFVYDVIAEMVGTNFYECNALFRTFIFRSEKHSVAILLQSNHWQLFPKMTMPCKTTSRTRSPPFFSLARIFRKYFEISKTRKTLLERCCQQLSSSSRLLTLIY